MGSGGDELLTEFDGGKRCFCHRLCEAWEGAARKAERYGTRVVRLRLGLVLGIEGGRLGRLLTPFELGLGGPIGSGEQWMSWIERDDLVRLIAHIIAEPRYTGAVNATAPVPVRNASFAQELGRALHRPALLRMPAFLLHWLFGALADELVARRTAGAAGQGRRTRLQVPARDLAQRIGGHPRRRGGERSRPTSSRPHRIVRAHATASPDRPRADRLPDLVGTGYDRAAHQREIVSPAIERNP